MKLPRRFALLFTLLSIGIVGIIGPFFLLHKEIYNKVLSNTRIAVENVFILEHGENETRTFKHQISKFTNLDIGHPEVFHLNDVDVNNYFRTLRSVQCFINGTDWRASGSGGNSSKCVCKKDWHGEKCAIPGVVWRSLIESGQTTSEIKLREKARRIIHGFNVNHEVEMFEVRVNELFDVVDVYLICESNFSAFGEAKGLFFLERFRQGWLHQFQDKFVYVFQDHFPEGGREDGWIADGYQRTFLGQQGMKQVSGIRGDDLFLLLDADEIPQREVLLFLKLHDGYKEPIRLNLRWTVYGYFWRVPDKSTEVTAIASLNMFHNAMANDGKLLRSNKIHPSLSNSFSAAGGKFNIWTIGDFDDEAGWHCSWCMSPEEIRWKLDAAQNGDKPRWGDYPEKKNLTYIENLIRTGYWFDDQSTFSYQPPRTVAQNIPPYVFEHAGKFRSILVNPYDNRSILLKTLDEFKSWFGISR